MFVPPAMAVVVPFIAATAHAAFVCARAATQRPDARSQAVPLLMSAFFAVVAYSAVVSVAYAAGGA